MWKESRAVEAPPDQAAPRLPGSFRHLDIWEGCPCELTDGGLRELGTKLMVLLLSQ